ncbi:NAD(P)-binding domain-containing protein [Coraliomargarita algicola]|uniref:NAD(P)-binding domain-containing protein n=1 Tax=Coraliomargarita algicola TaxID=3092156 RepID=A0ABZ0RI03_9BACT|nr:NAD(P)-binding domain-containing protein [Coraliomargarita sp. J2-16]WPJ95816.1 NAD(P)-binding domain-containing protein [Coraliomargarita sp. J2-16]
MQNLITRYTHWLHTRWPAGGVEKGPSVNADGTTRLKGVRVVGDLTGVPLLKFSADTGAKAVLSILEEPDFKPGAGNDARIHDLVIVGAGVSGLAAAIEAKKAGLSYMLFEADESFSTIQNFPRKKPIYTYPSEMTPVGELRFESKVKEDLLLELQAQQEAHGIETTSAKVEHIERDGGVLRVKLAQGAPVRAQRVIVAIGRTGNYRKLNVPGENLDKVSNRLIDAGEHAGQQVLVVGGGDSALEAAIALAEADASVTLSYRKTEFSRAKPENVERVQELASNGQLQMLLGTQLQEINEDHVVLCGEDSEDCKIANDYVFTLIGREPPLDFFRKSSIPVTGDWTPKIWGGLIAFMLLMTFLYHLKAYKTFLGIPNTNLWQIFASKQWFPFNIPVVGGEGSLLYTFLNAARNDPGFTFALIYTTVILVFGVRRMRRRQTPYVKLQTSTLMAVQVIPLFILPYLLFPYLYHHGVFTNGGFGEWFGRTFLSDGQGGDPNQFWRSFGFILAWPLFIYNIFTAAPIWGWIVFGFVQTFVVIPLIVWRWGKGAYCGWICSCGAMAETLGDQHRHKMPHGAKWNKLNMIGQWVLAIAFVLLALRIIGWVTPWEGFDQAIAGFIDKNELFSYKVLIDLWLAGAIGYGLYFHLSGRVWCRFACPLAALMHIYARFSQFRIFAEKKKCISCNVCTSVCHQGIDIMNFANKGLPMEDPECVRCSACVQSCPTGVLSFGRMSRSGGVVLDKLAASPIQMQELQDLTPVDQFLSNARKRGETF